MELKVVALAGGVGGARLADGLYHTLIPENLTIIVNTGDDFIHYGLAISPDLDTVCYTLAGLANQETGWGLTGDSFNALRHIEKLGGEDWFKLGDGDIGNQLVRTLRLKTGEKLSSICRDFCIKWGVAASILPMSDDQVRTKVIIRDGNQLDFQEYFVHQNCKPEVKSFIFSGSEQAKPTSGMIEAINGCDLVIICPSNPWVSIDPILSIQPVRETLIRKCTVAISPLIGGKAVKGPLAKMYHELDIEPSCKAIAQHYRGVINGLIIDNSDMQEKEEIEAFGIITKTTNVLMKNINNEKRLAIETLEFGKSLLKKYDKLGNCSG